MASDADFPTAHDVDLLLRRPGAHASDRIVLSHAAPRMLATIAAYEATIADLRKQLRAREGA